MCRWRQWRGRRSHTQKQCAYWSRQNSALHGCVSFAAQASGIGVLWFAIATENTAASTNTASDSFGRQADAMPLAYRVRGSETWSPMLPPRSCIPDPGAKVSYRNAERKLAPCGGSVPVLSLEGFSSRRWMKDHTEEDEEEEEEEGLDEEEEAPPTFPLQTSSSSSPSPPHSPPPPPPPLPPPPPPPPLSHHHLFRE